MPENKDVGLLYISVESKNAITELGKFNVNLKKAQDNSAKLVDNLNEASSSSSNFGSSLTGLNKTLKASSGYFKNFVTAIVSVSMFKKLADASNQIKQITNTFNKTFADNLSGVSSKFALFEDNSVKSINGVTNALDVARFYVERLKNEFDLTETQAASALANIGTMIDSLDFDKLSTAKIAGDLLIASKNWAEFIGKSSEAERIAEAFAKALAGEVGELKSIGIVINTSSASFKQLQAEMKASKNVTDEQANSLAIVEQLLNKTAIAAGAFNSMTIGNQFDNIKNTLNEIIAIISDKLNVVVAPILKTINTVLGTYPILTAGVGIVVGAIASIKTIGFLMDAIKAKQVEINDILGKTNEGITTAKDSVNIANEAIEEQAKKVAKAGDAVSVVYGDIAQSAFQVENANRNILSISTLIEKSVNGLSKDQLAILNAYLKQRAELTAIIVNLKTSERSIKSIDSLAKDLNLKTLDVSLKDVVKTGKTAEQTIKDIRYQFELTTGKTFSMDKTLNEFRNSFSAIGKEFESKVMPIKSNIEKTFNNADKTVQAYLNSVSGMTKTANVELSKQVLNNVKQLNDFHIRATVGKNIMDNTAKAMKNLNKETEKLHNGTIDLFDLIHLVPPELRGIIYPLSSLEKILPVVTTLQLAYNAALKGSTFSEITQNLLKLSNTTWISKLFDRMFNITVAGAGLIAIFKSIGSHIAVFTKAIGSSAAVLGALALKAGLIVAAVLDVIGVIEGLYNLIAHGKFESKVFNKLGDWIYNLFSDQKELQKKNEEQIKFLQARLEQTKRIKDLQTTYVELQQQLLNSNKAESDNVKKKYDELVKINKQIEDLYKQYGDVKISVWKPEDRKKLEELTKSRVNIAQELFPAIKQLKDKVENQILELNRSFESLDIVDVSTKVKKQFLTIKSSLTEGFNKSIIGFKENIEIAKESIKVYQKELAVINEYLKFSGGTNVKLLKEQMAVQQKIFAAENQIFNSKLEMAKLELETSIKLRDNINKLYQDAIGYNKTIQNAVEANSAEAMELQSRRLTQLSGAKTNTEQANKLAAESTRKINELQRQQLNRQAEQTNILRKIQELLNKSTQQNVDQAQIVLTAVQI